MKSSLLKRIVVILLLAGAVVGLGALVLRTLAPQEAEGGAQVWTCSMHPQVRLPRKGKCPICEMPLIPAKTVAPSASSATPAKTAADPHAAHVPAAPAAPSAPATAHEAEPVVINLPQSARKMAGVETRPVERRRLTHEIRAVGKVQYNESALAVISSRVEGYIERLYVDFTGVQVKKGDHLVEIYSPDLVLAQKELLVALDGPPNSALIESSRLKLLRWGLTTAQVDALVRERKVSERVTLHSPIDGTVTERMAVQQGMIKGGEPLYKLANLESVWVYLDIYESELGWVQQGQAVDIHAEAWPGESFSGRIWFINPVLTEESRTVKVLVNISNTGLRLKPGMFVSASIQVPVLADGSAAPTGLGGKFTCPMHPQVVQEQGGPCPKCGMALTVIPGRSKPPAEGDLAVLAVPYTAVLDSGTRKLAYIEHTDGSFIPAEVTTGPRAGDFYPVLGGLQEGQRVAVRGNFLLDSQFQIQGLPSLLHSAGQAPATGHQHGGSPAKTAPTGHEGHAEPPPAPATKPAAHKH